MREKKTQQTALIHICIFQHLYLYPHIDTYTSTSIHVYEEAHAIYSAKGSLYSAKRALYSATFQGLLEWADQELQAASLRRAGRHAGPVGNYIYIGNYYLQTSIAASCSRTRRTCNYLQLAFSLFNELEGCRQLLKKKTLFHRTSTLAFTWHTHTHTHSHTHTFTWHTRAASKLQEATHTHTHTHTHSLTHSLTHSHTHTHTRTQTQSRKDLVKDLLRLGLQPKP